MDLTPRIEALPACDSFLALTRYTRVFDPFKVMGVSTKELLHSRVIATFLNAEEPHGLGSKFRDEYLASLKVCRRVGEAAPLEEAVILNAAGARAKVIRERADIDILIDFPSLRLVIAIENKIHASDQREQLTRYQQSLCDLFPHYEHRAIVYLTPEGRDSPTANVDCQRVPIYYQSYAQIAELLTRSRPLTTPSAGAFLDQFIRHIERTMTDSSDIQELCWGVFEQNEDAFEHLAKHLIYCRERKYRERFTALKQEVDTGSQFSEWRGEIEALVSSKFKGDNPLFDLDVRLNSWPAGVWVKLYKHTWLGVFPYFLDKDGETVALHLQRFCSPSRDVPNWPGHKFASVRFQDREDRAVNLQGNRATDSDYNAALTQVRECIVEINEALAAAFALPTAPALA